METEVLTREQKRVIKIHNEIDTAQDRLYQQAVALIQACKMSTELENKAQRLKKLGFTNTPEVTFYGKNSKQLVTSEAQANLIQHYKTDYPTLKFLTVEELDRICSKYDLIYAKSNHYIKTIPDKNLLDIENAQPLASRDYPPKMSLFKITDMFQVNGLTASQHYRLHNEGYVIDGSDQRLGNTELMRKYINPNASTPWDNINRDFSEIDHSGLYIAAPKSHFNLNGLTKVGRGMFTIFKIEPKDPIVFRYVNGGIQVLTKWGAEAEDPALQL